MDSLRAATIRMAQIADSISALGSLTSPPPAAAILSAAAPSPFAAVLSDAISLSEGRTVSLEGRPSAASETTAAGVPASLAGFGNGRIPAEVLSPVGQGQHRLWAPAAEAFGHLSVAAARQGITIRITDSYRSLDEQIDLARRKGLYSQGGLAAVPGTSSHGWGKSVDLDLDPRAQAWMRANATDFGFVENVRREPWHWTYSLS